MQFMLTLTHYVDQAGLELAVIFFLSIPNAGFTGCATTPGFAFLLPPGYTYF